MNAPLILGALVLVIGCAVAGYAEKVRDPDPLQELVRSASYLGGGVALIVIGGALTAFGWSLL